MTKTELPPCRWRMEDTQGGTAHMCTAGNTTTVCYRPGDCETREYVAGLEDKVECLEDVASIVEALLERLKDAGDSDKALLEIKYNGEHSDIWAAHLADLLSELQVALKRAGR